MKYPIQDINGTWLEEAGEFLGLGFSHATHPEKVYVVSELLWQTGTDEYAYLLDDPSDGMGISMTRAQLLSRLASGVMSKI